MTKTFKVGDKVRCLETYDDIPSRSQFTRGCIYTVAAAYEDRISVRADDQGLANGWEARYFKLVASPRTIARDLALTPMAKVLMLHLEKHKTISPAEAKTVYGYPKVARQIWELRQDGIDIRTELRRDPRGQRYARYSLAA